jgi:uncharacterized protein
MRFEWNEAKRRSNIKRHGIDFVDVEIVFAGDTVTFRDDRFNYGETRFLTFGFLWGRVVAVVHTATDETIRVISFRKASKNEEKVFFKEIRN